MGVCCYLLPKAQGKGRQEALLSFGGEGAVFFLYVSLSLSFSVSLSLSLSLLGVGEVEFREHTMKLTIGLCMHNVEVYKGHVAVTHIVPHCSTKVAFICSDIVGT